MLTEAREIECRDHPVDFDSIDKSEKTSNTAATGGFEIDSEANSSARFFFFSSIAFRYKHLAPHLI